MFPLRLCVVVLTFVVPSAWSADPVYSPSTLSDSIGNSADNSSSITWADITTGDPYVAGQTSRISQGLEPYYNLVHSFINSVFAAGIPLEIVQKILNNQISDITSNYSNYVNYFIGYGICVAIGILFLIIFPIVACCVCCCRCCCKNCGGRNIQTKKEADNTCRKAAFSIGLLILVAFLFTGAACIYVNNNLTSTALNKISTETKKNLDDVRTYMNNTNQQVTQVGRTDFTFMKDAIFRDLDNIEYLVGLPLRQDIETQTGIRATLTTALTLDDDITTVDTSLTDIDTKKTALETSITSLDTALTDVRDNLDTTMTACAPSCSGAPDYTGASVNVDTTTFPDLSAQRTSIDSAKGTNLTAKVIEAEQELDGIPGRVGTDSLATRTSLKSTINDLSDNIDPLLNQVTDMNKLVSGENATIDLDSLSSNVEDFGDNMKTYDKYRWYGGVVLFSLVLFITMLALLGLILGTLSTCSTDIPPHRRGTMSQSGGCCLIISAVLVFIIADLLMLLTVLPFMLGAPVHRFLCQPLQDFEELDTILQLYSDNKVGPGKYFLGDMIHSNSTIPLTVTGMLTDCKNGKSVYESFKLSSIMNIDDLLDYSSTLDVQTEINGVNVDLSTVTIYNSDLQTQLADLSSATTISFSAFYTELANTPAGTDLSTLADDLDAFAADKLPPIKSQIEAQATELRRINSEEYVYVQGNMTALNSSVATMDSAISGVPATITSLDTGLQATDTYIQTNGSTVIRNLLNTYATRLLGIVNSYTAFTLSAVKTSIGQCQPIWNVYNSLLVFTFCYNIMDCFNGFWFSTGWCLFFFLPAIIFSMKLAKYYKKMGTDPEASILSLKSMNKVHPTSGTVINAEDMPPKNSAAWFNRNRRIHPNLDDCGDAGGNLGSQSQTNDLQQSHFLAPTAPPASVLYEDGGAEQAHTPESNFGKTTDERSQAEINEGITTHDDNESGDKSDVNVSVNDFINESDERLKYNNNVVEETDKGHTQEEVTTADNGDDKSNLPINNEAEDNNVGIDDKPPDNGTHTHDIPDEVTSTEDAEARKTSDTTQEALGKDDTNNADTAGGSQSLRSPVGDSTSPSPPRT